MSETNTVSPLRQHMIEDMAARKLNPHTQRSHIHSCKRFAAWLKRSPDTAMPDEVRRFQLYLIGIWPRHGKKQTLRNERSETAHRRSSHEALTGPLQGFRRFQPDRENENDVGLVEPGSGAARAITSEERLQSERTIRAAIQEPGLFAFYYSNLDRFEWWGSNSCCQIVSRLARVEERVCVGRRPRLLLRRALRLL